MVKVAVITGASAGIGRATAREFARRGCSVAQQDRKPLEPGRKDNLFEPVAGDHGAHGRFEHGAKTHASLLWASEHRGWVAAGAAMAVGAGLLSMRHKGDGNGPG